MKYFILLFILLYFENAQCQYDKIIRGGLIYNGDGGTPFKGDIAINADTIAAIGNLRTAKAKETIDGEGLAIAPGFINMLSGASESLIEDGRSQSDIRQGVTLEVMGEGWSMGPLNKRLKDQVKQGETDIQYEVAWNTLGEYLKYLENKGVSTNISSFVGATTIRMYVIGEEDRAPTGAELDSMKLLVSQAMQEGALGISSALIYPPAFFAHTDELVALCSVAAKYGGIYISHMRSEANRLYEAVEELITIATKAHIPAEIYHLKAAGKSNWIKMDSVIKRVENARLHGLQITADMYTYTAGATGLTACFPPSLQDGGFGRLWQRLQDTSIRQQMKQVMNTNVMDWENFYYGAGSPDKILLLGFKQDSLKKFMGKTLGEVAKIRGTSPEETAMDLIVQDSTRVEVAYFLMKEENVQKQISLPWVSFGSDEGSYAPEGKFLNYHPHPRAYGNFARVIGKYCRVEHKLSLERSIYKLSKLPATNLKLKRRGELKKGNYADIIVFDPAKVNDLATYENPQQYATGMIDVFVNGKQVLRNGEHTGAKPGRFIKGPGFKR